MYSLSDRFGRLIAISFQLPFQRFYFLYKCPRLCSPHIVHASLVFGPCITQRQTVRLLLLLLLLFLGIFLFVYVRPR